VSLLGLSCSPYLEASEQEASITPISLTFNP
jgi:hypothetical protein